MKYYILFLLFIFHIWLILHVNCGGKSGDKGKGPASKGVKSDGKGGVLNKFGRALSFNSKDNDKSQGETSSQKSKGKVPKNSSFAVPESDDGSDYDSEDEVEDKFVPNDGSFVPPFQNMRNPNPVGVPPHIRVGMNNPHFRGPSNPIRPQNPMRPAMQNRGIGGNPNLGPRMNNPNFPRQGPQFGGNPQFRGTSQFGQSSHFNPHMLPNPGYPNMPPQNMPPHMPQQAIVPYPGHPNMPHPYTTQQAIVPYTEQANAHGGNNQPETGIYFEYRNGQEVPILYNKTNWWDKVTDSY